MPKKSTKKNYASINEMPDGLKQYTLKLVNASNTINQCINTFTSCLYGRLIPNYPSDEITIYENMTTLSKMITKSVVNNACASNWCEFFQELADGRKPSELEDIRQAVMLSLVKSFNWQIEHYMPISIIGRVDVKVLKSTSYKPSHVFSEKDYKTVETSALDEAKRSARRYMDSQRGVRIDWKDKDGKNHTYIARPVNLGDLEEHERENMYYRVTMENRVNESGKLVDYTDLSLNEYFVTTLHNILMDGTITKKDYDMSMLVLNGYSYEDVGRLKECSKQYVGKRMLLVYKAIKEALMSTQDYELGDMPSEVERMVEKYSDLINQIEE